MLFWGTRGIYLDIESYNSTIHHNVFWNITGGKDSFGFVADSPRGYNKVFNNTFLGSVPAAGSVEALNNVFGSYSGKTADYEPNNLFLDTEPKFSQKTDDFSNSIDSILEFTLQPGSPAIDAGVIIPGITDDFAGDAPDLGAYEKGKPVWKAGSTLEYTPKRNN